MAELTVPLLDFSALGQLPQVYKKAQADELRQQTLASLGQGPLDPQSLKVAGIKLGDMGLLGAGVSAENTIYQHGRDDKSDARNATNDSFNQRMEQARLGLAQRSAARQDEGPLEKMQQRLKVLQANNIDPASPEGRAYAIGGEWSGPGGNNASLNPVFGVGPDGKPAMVQPTKSGVAIQTKLPDGFQISKEPIKVDSATGTTLLDPQTRQTIGFVPKNLAAAEVQKAEGEATGAAAVNLPQVLATSSQTLKTIEELKKHPGLDHSVGAWSVVPNIPGSAGADFAAKSAQLKGQTFLQAYQSLRGSGAITDIEGKKGEDAIANLDKAQSKAEYLKSLNELSDVVKSGMMRAHAKARGPGSGADPSIPAAPSAPAAPNVTSSGVKWSIQ